MHFLIKRTHVSSCVCVHLLGNSVNTSCFLIKELVFTNYSIQDSQTLADLNYDIYFVLVDFLDPVSISFFFFWKPSVYHKRNRVKILLFGISSFQLFLSGLEVSSLGACEAWNPLLPLCRQGGKTTAQQWWRYELHWFFSVCFFARAQKLKALLNFAVLSEQAQGDL